MQKLVNTATSSTATNIGKASILTVFAQASDADAEVKLYNEADASKTASRLVFMVSLAQQLTTYMNLKYQQQV